MERDEYEYASSMTTAGNRSMTFPTRGDTIMREQQTQPGPTLPRGFVGPVFCLRIGGSSLAPLASPPALDSEPFCSSQSPFGAQTPPGGGERGRRCGGLCPVSEGGGARGNRQRRSRGTPEGGREGRGGRGVPRGTTRTPPRNLVLPGEGVPPPCFWRLLGFKSRWNLVGDAVSVSYGYGSHTVLSQSPPTPGGVPSPHPLPPASPQG